MAKKKETTIKEKIYIAVKTLDDDREVIGVFHKYLDAEQACIKDYMDGLNLDFSGYDSAKFIIHTMNVDIGDDGYAWLVEEHEIK